MLRRRSENQVQRPTRRRRMMSEKPQPNPRSQGRGGLRVTVIGPILFALVAFILTLLIVISGSKVGMLEDAYAMTLNTSGVGQNIVQFSPASTSTSSASNPVESFFSGLLGNITSGVDGDLNSAEGTLVGDVVRALGISEYYSFHLRTICEGNLSSTSDPNAKFEVEKCSSYSNKTAGIQKLINIVPSSTTVGTTNISVPILSSVSSSGKFLTELPSTLGTATFAFYILALIGNGVSIPLSALAGIRAGSPLFHYSSLLLSMFTLLFQFLGAIVSTALVASASTVLNQFAGSIGLSAHSGSEFLAFTWVSLALVHLVNLYWTSIWFVEFRGRSYKARRRTEREMGNYRGIVKEVLSDLRLPRENKDQGLSTAVMSPTTSELRGSDPIRRNSYNTKV